jgi:hypothetical protein
MMIAVVVDATNNAKPENSVISSVLLKMVRFLAGPLRWLLSPPLLPPPFESHLNINVYMSPEVQSMSAQAESPLSSGFFNSIVT